MEKKGLFVFRLLLLLLLLAFEETPVRTEARLCESLSHVFKGTCLNDHNCAMICRQEGFDDGHCRGLLRHCYCTRPC
ncbi:hypothetical protein RJ641_000677 [Dillenia turbinata]|uniref:Knottins-like domain-containing protein n=1 Tax=Dillenia turbinata TaxID=194707 RepID=A0AAN8ZMK7_9MAGN